MKDLGPLKDFLGIEVACSPKGIFLSQRKYTLNIISEIGLLGVEPVAFPLEQNHHLASSESLLSGDVERYRRLVGHLLYLSFTCQDLSFVTVARLSAEAEYRTITAVTCELSWLKGLLQSLGIRYMRPMQLRCDSVIAASHVSTFDQVADLFTKALDKCQFDFLLRKLGIYDPHAST
ncbi:hypothetical protein LIER_36970 [Lithospermum erythrorhizon]|uniref:Reverse transcriptase Ty1/copia-type domain-containing protein n=1 Tax=Lithospermum erythrorhizon TaxID=34254 RepID=A0AAV3PEY9_LITER